MTLRAILTGNRFAYGAEVVSSRGLQDPVGKQGLGAFCRALLDDSRIGWISLTDNPGGGPMLPPDWMAGLVADRRERVVIHLTCKDLNRNGLEAAAWRYASEGFENILALTGDYPTGGFSGRAQAVFDLDSLALIKLLRSMNEGLKVAGRSGAPETLTATHFYIGCAVSPFKRYERELLPQYFKLLRKIRTGAEWVLPQLGYDLRKFHEVKLFLEARGVQAPVVGNVYRLTKGVARLFHEGKLAGCVVSEELLKTVEKYSAGPDKGRKFFNELAAKQLAVFKGLGFAAGYLGGIAKPEMFSEIIDLAESYGPDDWRVFLREIQFAQPDEFFLFEHDRETGLSDSTRINHEYLASLRNPPHSKQVTLGYRLSRRVHALAFARGKGLYGLLTRIFRRLDGARREGPDEPLLLLAGAAGQGVGLRLQGLRRLQPARLCLPLPYGGLFQDLAQRPLRRLGTGPLRAGRQGVLLGPGLRAAEVLRRVGADGRGADRDLQFRPGAHLVVGQHLPGPRPPRQAARGAAGGGQGCGGQGCGGQGCGGQELTRGRGRAADGQGRLVSSRLAAGRRRSQCGIFERLVFSSS